MIWLSSIGFVSSQRRLRFVAVALLSLIALLASQAAAEPIIVNKPAMESPETKFDEPELQAKYDEAWKTFAETVEAASAALNKELKARGQAAQEEGNLDLLKFWTEVNEAWEQTGEFEWDADEERRKWDRFAPSGVPHSVTIAARGAVETHRAAIEELQAAYKVIEQALVKNGDTQIAGEVRQEIAGLLEANDFKNEKGKRTTPGARRSVSKIRDQFVGEWSNPNWGFVNIFVAQKGTTDRGKVARRQADGRITDGGSWLVNADGQGRILWQSGGAKGWTETIALLPQGVLVGNRFHKGAMKGEGWIAWQEGFDWRGEQCETVEPSPEARTAIAGEWSHPNMGFVSRISESGNWADFFKKGGRGATGTWSFNNDNSYACVFSNGYRARVWILGDTMAELVFTPKGSLFANGRVLSRKKSHIDQ